MHAWRVLADHLHDIECDYGDRGMAEAKENRACRGLVISPYILLRLTECGKHGAGMLVKPPASRSQRDAARSSFQQLHAHVGFERGDVMAQRRLRDIERLRGPRQHAGVGDSDEVSKLPQS